MFPRFVGIGHHIEECRARIEHEMVDQGDATKIETRGNQKERVKELDVSLKKWKLVSQISTHAVRQDQRQPHPKGENMSMNPVRKARICWRCRLRQSIQFLREMPSVRFSHDRIAQSVKFPEGEMKDGRELEFRNMLNLDTFELT